MNTTNKLLLGIICLLIVAVVFLVLQFISDAEDTHNHTHQDIEKPILEIQPTPTESVEPTSTVSKETSPLDSPYLASYTITDATHGNQTSVAINATTRTITTNTLPNHEHGDFPSPGNPNEINAIQNTYTYPLTPTFTGTPQEARQAIVGINGIPFEPGTAERVNCTSGEEYRVVGLQDLMNLGMDMNNAHVQPTGLYHYHGSPVGLIDFADQGNDLVHVGFAADGHLVYYSKSSEYDSGYTLSTTPRSGTNCVMSGPKSQSITIEGTMPDGSFEEDWVYSQSAGDLDECNGTTINGQYVYLVTEEYPFIGRCLMGEFEEEPRPAGPAGQPSGRPTNR